MAEVIDGPESYESMKSTSATNITAITTEEYESSTTYISSEVGAETITGDSEEKGDDGFGDTLDGGNSITGKDSQDENADDTTDVSNGKGDDCDGSGGGDDGPRCDVTINEKEKIQDLNSELETFMAEVKQRFRSHKEELNAVTKKKEEYYEKWQCAETEYTSLKEKYDRRERKYESEIQRVTQSRNEFEAKWESAKKTIKEKELEIQKRMRERMDTIESERKQWGDIIQKLKKEKFQAAITKTRERLEEVEVTQVHELTATEEEEKWHACSQCKIFQQERDKKTEECDKSRIEYEKLRQEFIHTEKRHVEEKRKLHVRVIEIEESQNRSTVSDDPVVLSGINLRADIEKYRKLIDETKSYAE